MDLKKIRERIVDKTTKYLVDGDPSRPLLMSVFPGGGKTTNVIRTLFGYMKEGDERKTIGMTWKFIYLAPRHDIIEQAVETDYSGDYVWFRSRLKECNNPEVRRLMNTIPGGKEYFPVEYFCTHCQLRGAREEVINEDGEHEMVKTPTKCAYERKKREIEGWEVPSWAGVHHHIINYIADYMSGQIATPDSIKRTRGSIIDALVIEENPMKTLLETSKIEKRGLSDVQIELERFSWFIGRFPEFVGGLDFSDHVSVYRDVIDFLLGEIATTENNPSLKKRVSKSRGPDMLQEAMCPSRPTTRWERLQEYIDTWKGLAEWESFDVVWVRFLGKRLFEDIEKHGAVDDTGIVPTFNRLALVTKELGTLHRILGRIFLVSTIEKLKYHFIVADDNWKKERSVYININYFHGTTLPSVKTKIIALDGTGTKLTWDLILGKDCEAFPEKGKYPNVTRVAYDERSMYCMASYIQDNRLIKTGENLIRLAAMITKKRPGMTAIIGSKAMKSHVTDIFDDECIPREKWKYDAYYKLTSSNEMVRCDTIILLSTPRPPEMQLEASVELSGWPRDVWEEYYIDNEMIQAIARARPSSDDRPDGLGTVKVKRDDSVHIYVFGNRDIFKGVRGEELVKEQYTVLKPTWLEGKLKYGGDGSIRWSRKELRSVAKIMSCFGDTPLTMLEIKDTTGISHGMVKNVTGYLVRLGYLARDKSKIVKVRDTDRGNDKITD